MWVITPSDHCECECIRRRMAGRFQMKMKRLQRNCVQCNNLFCLAHRSRAKQKNYCKCSSSMIASVSPLHWFGSGRRLKCLLELSELSEQWTRIKIFSFARTRSWHTQYHGAVWNNTWNETDNTRAFNVKWNGRTIATATATAPRWKNQMWTRNAANWVANLKSVISFITLNKL